MSTATSHTPWFLWPFAALWDLLGFLLRLTGRLILAVLALLFMVLGVVLTMTVLGAPVGIPFAVFGMVLLVRALF
jgi:hypothetical protein